MNMAASTLKLDENQCFVENNCPQIKSLGNCTTPTPAKNYERKAFRNIGNVQPHLSNLQTPKPGAFSYKEFATTQNVKKSSQFVYEDAETLSLEYGPCSFEVSNEYRESYEGGDLPECVILCFPYHSEPFTFPVTPKTPSTPGLDSSFQPLESIDLPLTFEPLIIPPSGLLLEELSFDDLF
eukprot:Platyproteum_vivax@DN5893_c0_g1_i1.p1